MLDVVQSDGSTGVVIGVCGPASSKYSSPEGSLRCLICDTEGTPRRIRASGGEFFVTFSLHEYDGSIGRARVIGHAERAPVAAAIAEIDRQAPTGGTGQLYRATREAERIGLMR